MRLDRLVGNDVAGRVDRLELPFDALGVDRYGISKRYLADAMRLAWPFYKYYFRVSAHGLDHVPARGRGMLVGNHSGGVAIDAAMVLSAVFFEMDPPRLAQGMAEKFINRVPFMSTWASRLGQLTGLPETAEQLLKDERLLMVFPEGVRGTAKLYRERWSLVDFGTGFVRLALKTRTPIVPFGFIGGGDALPTIVNLYRVGQAFGAPYLPVTAYLVPWPRPVPLEVHFGAPLLFSGTGNEDDEVVQSYVDQVKAAIAGLVERGRAHRHESRKGLSR